MTTKEDLLLAAVQTFNAKCYLRSDELVRMLDYLEPDELPEAWVEINPIESGKYTQMGGLLATNRRLLFVDFDQPFSGKGKRKPIGMTQYSYGDISLVWRYFFDWLW